MDTKNSPEVWDRLSNESGRAYEAFKVYMFMNPAERSVVGAWREWTANPEAARPSPFFEEWAREYAWSERARAHDHHLELIRRRGMEKAIEEEAEFQARQVEQMRFRYNELMSVAYEAAMEWFEDAEWSKQNLRSSDVVRIIQIHMDGAEKFGVDLGGTYAKEHADDWDEGALSQAEGAAALSGDEDDDGWGSDIVAEIDAEAEKRRAEGDDSKPEEDLL